MVVYEIILNIVLEKIDLYSKNIIEGDWKLLSQKSLYVNLQI